MNDDSNSRNFSPCKELWVPQPSAAERPDQSQIHFLLFQSAIMLKYGIGKEHQVQAADFDRQLGADLFISGSQGESCEKTSRKIQRSLNISDTLH